MSAEPNDLQEESEWEKYPGAPDIHYYWNLKEEYDQSPTEYVRERLQRLKADCQANMFRLGDIWRAPGYSQWEVRSVTGDGEAFFVHTKKPKQTFSMRWDSPSLSRWVLIARRSPTP